MPEELKREEEPSEDRVEEPLSGESEEGATPPEETPLETETSEEGSSPEFEPEMAEAAVEEASEEESPEKLIQALEAEPEGEQASPSGEKKAFFPKILLGLGILICLLGITGGVYVLWTIINSSRSAVSTAEVSQPPTKTVTPSSPAREPLGAMPLEVRPEHSLVLKHFLIPLQSEGGAPVFIKASVVLYFKSQREVLKAKKLENPLRGMIFETFKNIPFYYWRSPEGVNKIKTALLKSLRERAPEGLKPSDVDVTGYILK